MKSLSFLVIFSDLILTGKFYYLNFFKKNGIDRNFFYQHHLLSNLNFLLFYFY